MQLLWQVRLSYLRVTDNLNNVLQIGTDMTLLAYINHFTKLNNIKLLALKSIIFNFLVHMSTEVSQNQCYKPLG